MGKHLDKIVETYIQQKEDSLYIDENNPHAKEIEEALRERISKLIIEEIVSENKQKIVEEADKIIAAEREKAHIKELKVLLWEGFIIAFIVGLLVNQATDIVSIFKGVLDQNYIAPTAIVIIILLLVCILVFSLDYIKKLVLFFKYDG